MSFWDWFKEDNSIKTTQEHFEYFDNIRKENLEDIEKEKSYFLLQAKIPEEFKQYVKWINDVAFYLDIPFLKKDILVRDFSDDGSFEIVFTYGYREEDPDFGTFEDIMKYAIGTNEIKVK